MNKIGSFEITKYEVKFIEGQPKIVISMVKVLDTEGQYVKFAKLKEVEPYLALYPVNFKAKAVTEKSHNERRNPPYRK